jgi:hypothetical protein
MWALKMNKGSAVVMKEKVRYPHNIRAALFSLNLSFAFNRRRTAITPIKIIKLNAKTEYMICCVTI